MKRFLLLLFAIAAAGCHQGPQDDIAPSPYAGEAQRDIKALSAEEIRGYLEGAGLGFAKAAELNGYPGPRHVLDLAGRLSLSLEQRTRVEEVFRLMQAEVQALGRKFIETEHALDRLFAEGRAQEGDVRALAEQSGRLEGRIRSAHLTAHLAMMEVLTPAQVAAYKRLRGYEGSENAAPSPHPGHNH